MLLEFGYFLTSFLLWLFPDLPSRNTATIPLPLMIITPIASSLFSDNYPATTTTQSIHEIRYDVSPPLYGNININLSDCESQNESNTNDAESYTLANVLKFSFQKFNNHHFAPFKYENSTLLSANDKQRKIFRPKASMPHSYKNWKKSAQLLEDTMKRQGMKDRTLSSTDNKLDLTILGLFELTKGTETRLDGQSELRAAKLAIDQINALGILPSFHMRLIYNDTQCDPGVAVDRFFHAVHTSMKYTFMPFLLGTACSEATEVLARIVPYWNIVQISYGSTAPALSDESEFPLFLRTVAPDSSHNSARIALIKYFGWDTIIALSQNSDKYSLVVNDLVTELEEANITCTATITFGENDYKEQLKRLKELDTRIIIGSFSTKLAPKLLCEAWKLGIYGDDYVWILPDEAIDLSGISSGNWWHASGPEDCSTSQVIRTLNGLIIVKSYGTVLNDEIKSSSGLTSNEFTSQLAERGVTVSRFAATSYDAVWSMGLALSNVEKYLINEHNISISQYGNSKRLDIAYGLIAELKSLNFLGVSGPVSFRGADRVGITAFYQMHDYAVERTALYTPSDGHLILDCPGCAKFQWLGIHPPVARRVFRIRMVTIDRVAFFVVACLACIGMMLALSFLIFNLHFRRHKSIKIASPRLNNMAAVGSVLVYGAVILLGLDHATLSNHYYSLICTTRVGLLSGGFSLAFGSMFTKTYRVHRIFTRSRSGVVKDKLLQDTQLISLICLLLLIDGLIVTLWVASDPMERYLRNLTLEINPYERGVVYQLQVETCRSQYTNGWLACLYTYKGLLLVVGVYMAWETRHVEIPALNDSQYIGMSVYSVVISSGIIVVLTNLLSDRVTLAFVIITILILSSTTATLGLLFLPQVSNILRSHRSDTAIILQGLGLKFECNTRRFAIDDKRELHYRVQVQNRVYNRQVAQLESELSKLEKQLDQESIGPLHASLLNSTISQRNLSIGGGLPLLLLSVLPPVIPRASWPSTAFPAIHRETVAFSSHPELEWSDPRCSLARIYNPQSRRGTRSSNHLSVFQRLIGLFDSNSDSRKLSTTSAASVATTLETHIGHLTGLVPSKKATSNLYMNDSRELHALSLHYGSGPIIHITKEKDRRMSLEIHRKESSGYEVNCLSRLFPSAAGAKDTLCDKSRNSPFSSHRIMPASGLDTIMATDEEPNRLLASHEWHSLTDDLLSSRIVTSLPSTNIENSQDDDIVDGKY